MILSQFSPERAFLRFHLKVGVRLGAKVLAPLIAIFFGTLFIFKIEFFVTVFYVVFVDMPFLFSALLSTGIAIGASSLMVPRICNGLNGWIRHLPLKSRTSKRLAVLSLFIALVPMLGALAIPAVLLAIYEGVNPLAYLAGLPVLGLSSALFVISAEQTLLFRTLALGACVLSASGFWPGVATGFALFAAADILSGSMVLVRRKNLPSMISRGVWVLSSVAWRALKWRIGLAYLPAIAFLAGVRIFVVHNELAPQLSSKIYLFGAVGGTVLICAFLSHWLAVRRPPWGWLRSLPRSSVQSVLSDSMVLAACCSPFLILVGSAEIQVLAPLVLCLPSLFLFSVWSMKRSYSLKTGAYGTVLLYGYLGSLFVCLFPVLSCLFALSVPLILKQAAEAERRLKVSLWLERHHLAEGDSLSWSRR